MAKKIMHSTVDHNTFNAGDAGYCRRPENCTTIGYADVSDDGDERTDDGGVPPVMYELPGLIRRARVELADGHDAEALLTLGRAQDILSEANLELA